MSSSFMNLSRNRRLRLFPFVVLAAVIFLQGCPPAKQVTKVEAPKPAVKKPPAAEVDIVVASVNLTKHAQRIEADDIRQFAAVLRKEQIDILLVQGLSRYPGVETRVDVVDELSRQAEMRNVFGETIALSGRQSGNAVFSVLPIRSSENSHYERIASNNFEAALQVIIDCGSRDIVFVSTLFPERASTDDVNTCANRLSELPITYINHPIVIAGNLPKSDVIRNIAQFGSSKYMKEDDAPRYWFSEDGSLKIKQQNVVHTGLGNMSVIEFSVFKSPGQ